MTKNVIILGAGAPDGVGGAVARRFANEGHHVIVTGRTLAKVKENEGQSLTNGGSIEARQADVTSKSDQYALFDYAESKGELAAVIYNAGNNARIPFEDVSADQFESYWRVNAFGGFLAAQLAMPIMRIQGHGSMIFTGASGSLRGKSGFGHFASGKAALRNLAQSLAREYGPQGVHVGHIIIDGLINGANAKSVLPDYLDSLGSEGALSPDAIADAYWFIHDQDRTAWTHELDLRPHGESW